MENMSENVDKIFTGWVSAPFEVVQQALNTISEMRALTTEEVDQLLRFGKLLADGKRLTLPEPKAKVGRPRGSKTRKGTEASGSAEV